MQGAHAPRVGDGSRRSGEDVGGVLVTGSSDAADSRIHVVFVGSAFAFALLGGLSLALALPIDALIRQSIGVGWVAHAQVHGHLQTVGFVGLVIVGMAYQLLPGFTGVRRLPHPRLVLPSFWLLAGGVLARTIGQPVANHPPFAILMAIGAWAEALGAGTFAANVLLLSWRASKAGRPFAPFFLAGASWFVVQAVLGALWITLLAQSGKTVLPSEWDSPLVFLQLFGFHLMFILGVAVRSFPVLFAATPVTPGRMWWRWALVQIGITVLMLGSLGEIAWPGAGWPWIDGGAVLAGTGLVASAALTGWLRLPGRLRTASRPFAYILQPAMAWLAIAGLLMAGAALLAAASGVPIGSVRWDAIRHIVAIGTVLMTIAGMAYLIVPELASERLAGTEGARRGIVVAIALSLAVCARVVPRLLPSPGLPLLTYGAMALAALLAMTLFGLLAYHFARGVRDDRSAAAAAHPAHLGPPRDDW